MPRRGYPASFQKVPGGAPTLVRSRYTNTRLRGILKQESCAATFSNRNTCDPGSGRGGGCRKAPMPRSITSSWSWPPRRRSGGRSSGSPPGSRACLVHGEECAGRGSGDETGGRQQDNGAQAMARPGRGGHQRALGGRVEAGARADGGIERSRGEGWGRGTDRRSAGAADERGFLCRGFGPNWGG